MKRSTHISLRLVPIVAAAFLAACETPERRTCVDESGRVAPDTNCAAQPSSGAGASWDQQRPGGHYYHWYWYRGGSSPIMGSHAPTGGSFSPHASSVTTRGGFGSTAAGHVSGG